MAPNHKLTNVIQGRKIQAVQQADRDLTIRFEDGSAVHIKLAEPTASVMVRDAQNKMEYAD
jgi:hypothetical protein